MSIYIDNGHADRRAYLDHLANQYGVEIEIVITLANVLGPIEDFDGLINLLEEYTLE